LTGFTRFFDHLLVAYFWATLHAFGGLAAPQAQKNKRYPAQHNEPESSE